MKTYRLRAIALSVLVIFTLALAFPIAAAASVRGRRNTAIVLTAGTIVSAIKGRKTATIVLGAGSVIGWTRVADAKRHHGHKHHFSHRHHSGRCR